MADKHGSDTYPAVEDWARYKKLVLDKLSRTEELVETIRRESHDRTVTLSSLKSKLGEIASDIQDMGKAFDKLEQRVTDLEKEPIEQSRRVGVLGTVGISSAVAGLIEGISRAFG